MADFGFLGKALFGIFQKGVLEGDWGHDTTWGGTPQGWPAKRGSAMDLHMALPYGIFLFMKGIS